MNRDSRSGFSWFETYWVQAYLTGMHHCFSVSHSTLFCKMLNCMLSALQNQRKGEKKKRDRDGNGEVEIGLNREVELAMLYNSNSFCCNL